MFNLKSSLKMNGLLAIFFIFIISIAGYSLSAGSSVGSIQIRDASDNPAYIPDIGSKVVSIIYADPDAADVNDPLADALKARKFDRAKYHGMGIANTADTWKPNALIRLMIRRKIKKYNSTILTDTNKTVAKTWGLGATDGYSIVIVIGKDRKVKFINKVKTESQSRAITSEVLGIIEKEIGK